MYNKKLVLFITLLTAVALLVGCAGGEKNQSQQDQQEAKKETQKQTQKSNSLTIKGSSTVLPIVQKAAEAYMKNHQDVSITVSGGGSGNGIAGLIDGAVDIADASRMVKEEEVNQADQNGVYPVPHRIAKDGIAVVTNPNNSIDNLTLEQIKKIYTGKITNWKEVGGPNKEIVVVSRDSSSGTFEVFQEIAVDGKRVIPSALMQSSNGTVKSTVAETEGAIGYIGLGYLNNDVKAIKVNGVKPSNKTVANGKFPIARPLFMFTNGWPKGLANKFISFILSHEGQKIVKKQGYVPLY